MLFSSAPTICFGNKRERTRDPVCWWFAHLSSHLHRHVGNHVCPSAPSTIKFTPLHQPSPNTNNSFVFIPVKLWYRWRPDPARPLAACEWRAGQHKAQGKISCFLAFCLFPPCLNKVCWLRSKEVDAERFASRVGVQDDCVWCLTIQHTAGKANQIRPFFSRTSYGHFPPPSYRWTPRRAKGSNEIISWIMQQLCNKLSDHTFKIEKGKDKQQQKKKKKKSEKTRDFCFSPFFPCRSPACYRRPNHFCRLPWCLGD